MKIWIFISLMNLTNRQLYEIQSFALNDLEKINLSSRTYWTKTLVCAEHIVITGSDEIDLCCISSQDCIEVFSTFLNW